MFNGVRYLIFSTNISFLLVSLLLIFLFLFLYSPKSVLADPDSIHSISDKKSKAISSKIKGNNVKKASNYDNMPFDITAESLPSNYIGHDMKLLYSRGKQRKLQGIKGEFETTEQHNYRLNSSMKAPVIGNVFYNDLFAFVPKAENIKSIEYDADQKRIIIRLANSGAFNDSGEVISHYGIHGPVTSLKTQKYIGENAFGTKRTIRKIASESIVLKITNENGNICELHSPSEYIFDAKDIDSDYARRLKNDLRIVIIFNLIDVSSGKFKKEPTFVEPEEYIYNELYIVAYVKGVWLYDRKNGKVLNKYYSKYN